jgi:parallel beta-helix repeat protein
MELMDTHHAGGSGIFISHGRGGHLLLNCDSHDNYDRNGRQGDGQNADGFGVHYQAAGDGARTIIRGCRAWWNSDDGYDFINQEVPVTIENSMAFGNGYVDYGTARPGDGNGNGFKIGSSKTGIRHLVQNNIAWGNRAAGFYANHSAGGNTWYNNTAFQNGTQFNLLASTWSEPNGKGTRTDGVHLTGALAHIMRNNIAFPNKNSYIDGYGVDSQFNTWDLNITPANKDFVSLTDATIGGTGQAVEATSLALGPRQPDGSPPNIDFLRLAAGSAMIDKGKDVGLPFVGAAPDLGAYEFGATGSGGTRASGGATSSGGAGPTGGATSAGGAAPGGGAASTGGSKAMGGASNTAGAAAGGSQAAGGATSAGVGGNVSTAGRSATGGVDAMGGGIGANTGGSQNMGGLASMGGSLAASGNGALAGSSGDHSSDMAAGPGDSADPGSCGCRVPGGRAAATGVTEPAMLFGLAFVNLLRRRQRSRRKE